MDDPDLVGFVREGSSVSSLKIEVLPEVALQIGQLLVAPTSGGMVYYQVTHAETAEEPFRGLNYGSHGVDAAQVGRLGKDVPFSKYPWLPAINAPVFLVSQGVADVDAQDAGGLFELGAIPGTGMSLMGDFINNLESHTAILGVTGSGKTEFALDLVRHAVDQGVKVVCIDLTAQYADASGSSRLRAPSRPISSRPCGDNSDPSAPTRGARGAARSREELHPAHRASSGGEEPLGCRCDGFGQLSTAPLRGLAGVVACVDLGEQFRFLIGIGLREQGPVGIDRSQGHFEHLGRAEVDGGVRLDVVALGDRRGGVPEVDRGRVDTKPRATTVAPVRRHQRGVMPESSRLARTRNSRKVLRRLCWLSGPPVRLAKMVRSDWCGPMSASRRRSTRAANSGTGTRRTEASVLGFCCLKVPCPWRYTTVPRTWATIPLLPS